MTAPVVAIEAPPAAGQAPGSTYVPLVPGRVLDTRIGLGAPAGKVGPGRAIEVLVTGQQGVPAAGVDAVVVNVTVTEPTTASFVTVWPTGAPRPFTSNLNMVPGQTVPNLVIAKVGTGGRISLFNHVGATHLVADVMGWYPATGYHSVVPARLLDTRVGLGAPAARVGSGQAVDLAVTGRGGVPAAGVDAVVVNVTVTEPTTASFVTVWPAGAPRPFTSNVNMVPGQTVPNLVIAKVGTGGRISLFNHVGATHLVADVVGWFAPGQTQSLVPTRVLDTRIGLGTSAAFVRQQECIALGVTGVGGVPATGVGAVVLNLTATETTTSTFVAAWPSGAVRPFVSNLNLGAGQTAANLVIAKVGDGGRVTLLNNTGFSQLVVDVMGWFPSSVAPAEGIVPEAGCVVGRAATLIEGAGASSMSGDGRLVSFSTPGPPGELFVLDRTTGRRTQIPGTFPGIDPTNSLVESQVSADGTAVAFRRADTSNGETIYRPMVYDVASAVTDELPLPPGSTSFSLPALSANGRVAAYAGVEGTPSTAHLYVFDRVDRTTIEVPPTPTYRMSGLAVISADGRYVAYCEVGSDPTLGIVQVLRFDRSTGTTLSVSGSGRGICRGDLEMSPDGDTFAWGSGGFASFGLQMTRVSTQTWRGASVTANAAPCGFGRGGNLPLSFDADGSRLAFSAPVFTLANPTGTMCDHVNVELYDWDADRQWTVAVSDHASTIPSRFPSPQLSADGRVVLLDGEHATLVPPSGGGPPPAYVVSLLELPAELG